MMRRTAGTVEIEEVRAADYRMSEALGDRYSGMACIHDVIVMQKADWQAIYRRSLRQGWSIPAQEIERLRQLLAASTSIAQAIAFSLRLADLEPSGEWFKGACRLAQTSTRDQIEGALYYIQGREEYITAALALVHYELFNSFELGEYVVKVDIEIRDGKFLRQWTNP